jgi:hypothetical protein
MEYKQGKKNKKQKQKPCFANKEVTHHHTPLEYEDKTNDTF